MSSEPTLTPAPEVVERALAASRADGCVVIVREVSSVNARFAVNTATSNGRVRSREVTVVSVVDGAEGVAAASVARSGAVDVDRNGGRVRGTGEIGPAGARRRGAGDRRGGP